MLNVNLLLAKIIAVSNVGIIDRVYEPYKANSITRKKKEPGPQSLAHSFTNNRYLTQEECASMKEKRNKSIVVRKCLPSKTNS